MTHCKYFLYKSITRKHREFRAFFFFFHFPGSHSQFLESKLCPYHSTPSRSRLPLPHPGQFNISHCLGFVLWNNIFSWELVHAKCSPPRVWKFFHKTFFQQLDPGGNLIGMFKILTRQFSLTLPTFL